MSAELPVTVISVTHNSGSVIGAFIDTVPTRAELIIVDNASTDGTRRVLATTRARIVTHDRNLGFGAACNAGARLATGEFLFFVNPDARIRDGAVEALIAAARRYPGAAAFNPMLLDEAGKAMLRAPSRFLAGRHSARAGSPETDHEVDVVSGAALFCRRTAFERSAGFDERIFLYFEDDDLSLRLLAGGGKLMHVAAAKVQHHQGRSTAPAPSLVGFKNFHWMRSYRYVAEKHGQRFPATKLTVQTALRLATARLTGNRQEQHKFEGRLAGLRDPIRAPGKPAA